MKRKHFAENADHSRNLLTSNDLVGFFETRWLTMNGAAAEDAENVCHFGTLLPTVSLLPRSPLLEAARNFNNFEAISAGIAIR